jgi:ferric-dicitrate binding protein FerR (iron transport regulator)
MNDSNDIPEDLQDLIDEYLSDSIDQSRLKELEARLLADEEARRYFVRYCRLHTDLDLEARARKAGAHALASIDQAEPSPTPVAYPWRGPLRWGLPLAAAAILAVIGLWLAWKADQDRQDNTSPREEMAWLSNAQNCQWAPNMAPRGTMQSGKIVRLERGLAEIVFQKGARVLLEGPATLEVVSGNSARLHRGKLSAKVPETAKGFQIITPQGKVVDLGTEFVMAVEEDGSADVYVLAGKVEAYSDAKKSPRASFLSLQEKQGARIDGRGVSPRSAPPQPESKPFVRDIPVIVPRVFMLDFARPIPGTLLDAQGEGTGLTHRLPGTGKRFKSTDENLNLNLAAGQLELTTTNSDLNTQFKLDRGEYIGIKLTDLGFTGVEDFAFTVVVPDIPALQRVGQFGLYAGLGSDSSIRGGLLSRKEPEQYRQFLVQNHAGKDAPPHYVGLTTPGDDLRLTLRRDGKQYSLTVENQTTGNSTILTMPQPPYLEGQRDIYVGFFGANTQSEIRRTLILKEFKATVWTVTP